MKRIYEYLFYRVHCFTKKLGNYDVAFSSICGLSILLGFNFFAIYYMIVSPNYDFQIFKYYAIIFSIFILSFNYYLFVYKNKYRKIERKFSKETQNQKRIGSILVLIYIAITIALVLVCFSMSHTPEPRYPKAPPIL